MEHVGNQKGILAGENVAHLSHAPVNDLSAHGEFGGAFMVHVADSRHHLVVKEGHPEASFSPGSLGNAETILPVLIPDIV